jgi:hypothetical protein
MTRLPLAAVLLAAALGANAQKIDLSGLTGGPSPSGPSAGSASAGPERDIVLAAIREVGASDAAKSRFALLFGARSKPDGTSEAYDAAKLGAAAAILEGMIKSGAIAIKPVSGGAAGAWAPDISNGAMTGGTFEVGDARGVKDIGRSSRSFSQLFKQDQYANTILHETVHMFYSVAVLVQGFTPQSQPAVVESFRSYSFWNGSRPQSLGAPYPYEKPPCGNPTCYQWKISAHGYGKDGNATEYLARTVSQELCDADNCAAYGRVLAPVFR